MVPDCGDGLGGMDCSFSAVKNANTSGESFGLIAQGQRAIATATAAGAMRAVASSTAARAANAARGAQSSSSSKEPAVTKDGRRPAPPANDGGGPPHGAPDHNRAIDNRVREVRGQGATDIPKNQTQSDAQGNRVGDNRPDLGYTDRDGVRHNEEWGRDQGRLDRQGQVARQNDPSCVTSSTCLLN
jgi:hypothetical protein